MAFRLKTLAAAILFALLVIPTHLAAQNTSTPPKHSLYSITDLGTLGGTFSEADGVNNKGWLVGNSALPGDNVIHGYVRFKQTLIDVGTLGGPNSVVPEAEPQPNNRGQVVAVSETATPDPNGEDFCLLGAKLICLPFIWDNGFVTTLRTLGGNNAQAWQISNRGLVAGTAETSTPDPSCTTLELEAKPVVWEQGNIQQLPTVGNDLDGSAQASNDSGQVVGFTADCVLQVPFNAFHAVLWEHNLHGWVATDLGNLGGSGLNIAFGINNRGQIVGQSGVPDGVNFHAFLWTKEQGMKDLGVLPGDVQGWAETINDSGEAVGTSFDVAGTPHPFVWRDGVMTNLNNLIRAGSPWVLLEALGNNESGQIVGFGYRSDIGEAHGYLATPCDRDQANADGCEDSGNTASAINQAAGNSATVVPEKVRTLLLQRGGFIRRIGAPGLRP